MTWKIWIASLSLAAGLWLPLSASDAPEGLTETQRAHQALLKDLCSKNREGKTPNIEAATTADQIHRSWRLAGQFASAFLDGHPKADARELVQACRTLAPPSDQAPSEGEPLQVHAVRLREGCFVVTVAYYLEDASAGTFFVLDRDEAGHHRMAWHVLPEAQEHLAKRDELGHWAYLSPVLYYSGSLIGTPHELPTARNGHPRFYIHAQQHAHGGTAMLQASFWEWDGREAKLLLIRSYKRGQEEDGVIQHQGDRLLFPTRENSDAFMDLGAGMEPQGTWSVRVTPSQIQDLGHRWNSAGAQLVDRLCARLQKGQEASDLASPEVIAWMKQRFPTEPDGKQRPYFMGFLNEVHTTRIRGGEQVRLDCDEGSFLFRIERHAGKRFLRSIRLAQD